MEDAFVVSTGTRNIRPAQAMIFVSASMLNRTQSYPLPGAPAFRAFCGGWECSPVAEKSPP
jgi:hypothetical protein